MPLPFGIGIHPLGGKRPFAMSSRQEAETSIILRGVIQKAENVTN
jgi:hypothetical protein